MLIRLAFKNVGKSYKDYGVYFFTLGFGVCVFYLFNAVYAQGNILEMHDEVHQAMDWLNAGLHTCSILVAFVMGFLVVYANSYFMSRRKKELGIYMTLGMSKVKISIVYVLETSLVACLALLVGLFMGIFLSQFMAIFTAYMFETKIRNYYLVISTDAILESIFTFGVIFILVIVFNIFAISRYKLVDFLYSERKNRNLKIRNSKSASALLALGITCIVASYYGLLRNGLQHWNPWLLTAFLMGALGTILVFYSITGIITALMGKKEKWYYKDLNMFFCRQLNYSINANFIVLSVVCFTMYFTMSIFVLGYSMQSVVSKEIKETICYDMSFYESLEQEESLLDQKIIEFLDDCPYAGEYELHRVFYDRKQDYHDFSFLPKRGSRVLRKVPMLFLKESDFNNIRRLQHLQPIKLQNGGFTIVSNDKVIRKIIGKILENGVSYSLKGDWLKSDGKAYKMNIDNADYEYLYMVISDDKVEQLANFHHVLNANAKSEKQRKQFEAAVKEQTKKVYKTRGYSYSISKTDAKVSAIATRVVISYGALYLGIVFLITCGVILAVRQLSDTTDNKYRYQLLSKLGVDDKMLLKVLRKQISFYFAAPLVLGTLHAAILMITVNRLVNLWGYMGIGKSIGIALGFTIVIDGIYYALTYVGSKNMITKERELWN